MNYWYCDYGDATSFNIRRKSLAVSDTATDYGERIVYVVPKVTKIVSKVCGERYRLTQNRGQIRSVTDVHSRVRIRSPTVELR